MGTSKAKAVEIFPTISNVKVGHVPLIVGDTENFTVTSNFVGQVQYKAFLFDGKQWSPLSAEYGVAVDAKNHLCYLKQSNLNSVNTNFQFG